VKATLIGVLLAAVLTATAAAPGASDAGRWQVIRSKTVYGDVAATGVNATVRKPKGIAVRFQGSGVAAWGCSKGVSVSSWSRQFTGGGFHVLPYVRGKDSCDVVASVSGQHVARVWIYKARW
jgi:hypothetical protein